VKMCFIFLLVDGGAKTSIPRRRYSWCVLAPQSGAAHRTSRPPGGESPFKSWFLEPVTIDEVCRDGDGVFAGGVDHGLRGRVPRRGVECGALFQREPGDADGPGENRLAAGDELDLQDRRARRLHQCDAAPESAFDFEIAAGQHAGIGLTDSAANSELAASAGATAAIDGGP